MGAELLRCVPWGNLPACDLEAQGDTVDRWQSPWSFGRQHFWNYTSIDPKQRQHFFGVGVNSENSNVGGNECKYTFLKPPAVWQLHARTQSRATEPSHRVQGRGQ